MLFEPNQIPIDLGYQKLAPRNLLSATFSLLGPQLVLDGFDSGQNLTITQSDELVNGIFTDAYSFELSEGSWSGLLTSPNLEIASVNGGLNNQLQIATSIFGGAENSLIAIDGATGAPLNIDIGQLGTSFSTRELELSNITAVDSSLNLDIDGRVILDSVAVIDSNPNDALTIAAGLNINGRDGIEVRGDLRNDIENGGAGISLTTAGITSDVTINGQVSTTAGTVNVFAGDSIFLGRIDSGSTGNAIVLLAGGDIIDFSPNGQPDLVAPNGLVTLTSGRVVGLFESDPDSMQVVADRLIVNAGGAVHIHSAVNEIDVEVNGDLIIHNAGDLSLNDLDNDGIAVASQVDGANLLITTGPRLQISGDIHAANAQRLALLAGAQIESELGVQIFVDQGHLQLNAADHIFVGHQLGDQVRVQSIGLVTKNAHFETDAGILIDAKVPNRDVNVFGTAASLGTQVEETLFVKSTQEIRQTEGELDARQIGLDAGSYVQLSKIGASNETIAITARGAGSLSDLTIASYLEMLARIDGSEVNPNETQTIAFLHQGIANIGVVDSPIGTMSVSGLNSFANSIFVIANDGVNIQQDIAITSAMLAPQVNVYVTGGTISDPKIEFENAVIRVEGLQNRGVVNSPFTDATFFDSEGFVFRGTTEDLVLNADGTADQNIVIEYGHPGEAGYRVRVFWDIGIRPNNPTGKTLEAVNTFVSNVNDFTGAYDDSISLNSPSTLNPIGSNEGRNRETFSKVGPYSKEAIINHLDEPKVFSLVTVQNNQHINLFAGSLDAVDNSLNVTEQIIRADLDSPKKFAIPLPPINAINPIEIRPWVDNFVNSSTTQDIAANLFDRNVQPFESGDLKWVRVEIPLADLVQYGDDVRIKDPAQTYQPEHDTSAIAFEESMGENEVEEIIAEIEKSRDAEPGFWYKVFKDYKNRDDELFFYHLKSGHVPQPDVGPQNDFTPEPESIPIPGTEIEPKYNFETPEDEGDENGSSNLESGGLNLEKTNVMEIENRDTNADNSSEASDSEIVFTRLARLKRKIERAMS